jgi:hypothetical protein
MFNRLLIIQIFVCVCVCVCGAGDQSRQVLSHCTVTLVPLYKSLLSDYYLPSSLLVLTSIGLISGVTVLFIIQTKTLFREH